MVEISGLKIANNKNIILIAGPCSLESELIVRETYTKIKEITDKLNIPFIFKISFDKANRMSHKSFRGQGIDEGIKIIKKIKTEFNTKILTDVHCVTQVDKIKDIVDIIQIPAFLCRQTDLVIKAAETGKPLNIKKGQFIAPEAMTYIIKKAEETGNRNIILTERGSCFGYGDLVVDYRSIEIMKKTGYPVIFDGTHSVQKPSRGEGFTGGMREYIEPLCLAAAAVGVAGFYLEVHPDPDKALCDGPNMIPTDKLEDLLVKIKKIDNLKFT